MKCTHCDADNEDGRKFCRDCGIAIGVMCDRCKIVNPFGDTYCGMCGFKLLEMPKEMSSPSDPLEMPQPDRPGQYTARDIKELLSLRTKLKKEEDSLESLRQDDIDKLFGRTK
ncbi:MAG: zinc ribbon domain-containing protein [Ignavibacteriales bacterium]|nr:zinc ribbon domain-containing protein [Ignavibacteriales bacterium]